MTAAQILSDLQASGVVVAVLDGDLSLNATKGTLTPNKLETIRENKAAIISLLTDRNDKPELRPRVNQQGNNYDDWRVRETLTHVVYESPNAPQYDWTSRMRARGLIDLDFPPHKTLKTPPEILAAAVVICPRCHSNRVLPELESTTCGLCWQCLKKRI